MILNIKFIKIIKNIIRLCFHFIKETISVYQLWLIIRIAKFANLDRNRHCKTLDRQILHKNYLLQLSSIMRQEVIPIIFCFDMSICICINNNTSMQRVSILFPFQFAKEIAKVQSLDNIQKLNK